MKKQIALFRIIAFIMIVNLSVVHAFAQENAITNAIIGCSKCITDCAINAISLASETLPSESTAINEEYCSDYPEGYDPNDPIAMGEVDPWEAYRAQQEEEMDRAMAEEAQRAWQEYNEPQPDISDRIIKP